MKKVKNLLFVALVGVITILTSSNVHAAAWTSTLNLPYGTSHGGASRNYAAGEHKIDISVDGFNKSNGSVRKSGSTTMGLSLWDVSTGRDLKYKNAIYTYGTCADVRMGSYSAGRRSFIFLSRIYNEGTGGYNNYDGIKSNSVKMYPKA